MTVNWTLTPNFMSSLHKYGHRLLFVVYAGLTLKFTIITHIIHYIAAWVLLNTWRSQSWRRRWNASAWTDLLLPPAKCKVRLRIFRLAQDHVRCCHLPVSHRRSTYLCCARRSWRTRSCTLHSSDAAQGNPERAILQTQKLSKGPHQSLPPHGRSTPQPKRRIRPQCY